MILIQRGLRAAVYRTNSYLTRHFSLLDMNHHRKLKGQKSILKTSSKAAIKGLDKNHVPVKTLANQSSLDENSNKSDSGKKINENLSTGAKLKLAVRDYGGTVLVFHITMSLASLGFFYAVVSSGLDIVWLLSHLGLSEKFLESKMTQGGSTFVIAYAIHKVFAPVRLAITLTAVPFIVKKLRAIGFLKKPQA